MYFETDELFKVQSFQKYHVGSSFTAVGVPIAPIVFQIPAVDNPRPSVDGDWMQMVANEIPWQLDATNHSTTVNGAQTIVRIVRAANSDNCNWKW